MAENKALISRQTDSALTPWASRGDVRELGKRIKELLPGGEKLKEHEALALAQAAVAHQLDPFNGELWFIPGRGLMAGIKGHRRSAHHQMESEGGGNYWPEFDGPLSVDEMTALKIPIDALAFRCRLFDSKNITTYTDSVAKLLSAGAPWDEVSRMFGQRPYTEGIGYWRPGEPTKMTPVQCAMKRAEAEALKRRFDLPFTMAVGVNGDVDVIEGDFTVQQPQTPEQAPAEIQERMQAASAALRADQGHEPSIDVAEKSRPTEVCKPAKLRYQSFVTWCNTWVKAHPEYSKSDGVANMYHILGRVGNLKFAEVTAENMQDVQAALEAFVRGKADPQQAA